MRRVIFSLELSAFEAIALFVRLAEGRNGELRRERTDWELKGKRYSIVLPARRGVIVALMIPWT